MATVRRELGPGQPAPSNEAGMFQVDRGHADIGVNFREQVDWAYRGIAHNQHYPLTRLRALANLVQPQYVGIAATAESGFTSLEQIAAERRPIRLFTVARSKHQTATMGLTISRVLELSGFTQDDVIAWGGRVYTAADSRLEAISRGDVDVIAIPAYPSWGPSWGQCWMVAQIRLNLRFLPIADHVLDAVCAELNLRKGMLPAGTFRGVDRDVPTLVSQNHTVCTHADLSDSDAYTVVQAIDEHPDCLQTVHVPFAYYPFSAWQELGVPLHPGAEAYYRERGYLTASNSVAAGV